MIRVLAPFKTTAGQVRTGYTVAFAEDGYQQHVEVDIVHLDADGRVRFTGWTAQTARVEQGWPHLPSARVIVADYMGDLSFLALLGGHADSDVAVDAHLDDAPDGDFLL